MKQTEYVFFEDAVNSTRAEVRITLDTTDASNMRPQVEEGKFYIGMRRTGETTAYIQIRGHAELVALAMALRNAVVVIEKNIGLAPKVENAQLREIITNTIGFEFEFDGLQQVNASDLLRIAHAVRAMPAVEPPTETNELFREVERPLSNEVEGQLLKKLIANTFGDPNFEDQYIFQITGKALFDLLRRARQL